MVLNPSPYPVPAFIASQLPASIAEVHPREMAVTIVREPEVEAIRLLTRVASITTAVNCIERMLTAWQSIRLRQLSG